MSLKTKIKQYGVKNSFNRAVKSLLRRIGIQYESFYLMVNHIDPNELKQKMERYDYSDVKELTIDDFKTSDPDVFDEKKLQIIRMRLDNGKHQCYGIFEKERLIYSTWISTDRLVFSSPVYKAIPIKSSQAILEDSYCHPDYRNKGLHSQMILFRLNKIIEMGLTEAIAIVVVDNIPAVKTQLKNGFYKEKKIWIVKIFGRTYYIEKELL